MECSRKKQSKKDKGSWGKLKSKENHLGNSCCCCCCSLVTALVGKLCPIFGDPMDYNPSVHAISQAKILEWVAISFSMGSFWPRDWTCISFFHCRWILYCWATREALGNSYVGPNNNIRVSNDILQNIRTHQLTDDPW